DTMRIDAPPRHRRAGPERARQGAAPAAAGAGGRAANAVRAEAARAFAARRAGPAERLRATAAVHAGVPVDAVGVARALADAGAAGARIGGAALDPGRAAGSKAVTGAGGVQLVAAARGDRTDGLDRVLGAPPGPVADTGQATGGGLALHADRARVGDAGGDRPAGTEAVALIATDAGTGAGAVAAEAVDAESGGALTGGAARGARQPLPAAAVHALHARRTVTVGRTLREASAGAGVAVERRADGRRARHAAPGAVADADASDRGAAARAGLADAPFDVRPAVAFAVARAVQPAGGGRALRAEGRRTRRVAGGHEAAGPRRRRRAARFARLGAGAVAAEPVDAEPARAIAGAATRRSVGAPAPAVAAAGHGVRTAVLFPRERRRGRMTGPEAHRQEDEEERRAQLSAERARRRPLTCPPGHSARTYTCARTENRELHAPRSIFQRLGPVKPHASSGRRRRQPLQRFQLELLERTPGLRSPPKLDGDPNLAVVVNADIQRMGDGSTPGSAPRFVEGALDDRRSADVAGSKI